MEIRVKLRKRQNKVWHGFSAQKYILEYHTQYHTQPFELGRKFGVKFPRDEARKENSQCSYDSVPRLFERSTTRV